MTSLERLKLGCDAKCSHRPTIEEGQVDRDRFNRGRQFFHDHMASVMFSYLSALMVGFSVEQLSEALQFTGRSIGADQSKNRYLSTAAHLYLWHKEDIFDRNSMAHRSISKVSNLHRSTQVDMTMSSSESRLFFSQYDMALVQSGFIGPIVMYPEQFGIRCDRNDLDDYVYFWRVIGSMLGIEDQFNVAQMGLEEAKVICKAIEQEVIAAGVLQPTPLFTQLSIDFATKLQSLVPLLTRQVVFALIFPLAGLKFQSKLIWWERLMLALLRVQFWLSCRFPVVRRFVNCRVDHLMSIFVQRYLG